jgi:hypothetical protein
MALPESQAQVDSASLVPGIRSAADSMMVSFRRRDFTTFARYNNENLVQMLGGPEGFAKFLEGQILSMEGLEFTDMRAGKIIRLVPYQDSWQCIVEQYVQVSVQGAVISSVSHLVGITRDQGKSWHFADPNQGTLEQFKLIMPELNPNMPVPRKMQVPGKTLDELLRDYKTTYEN